MTDAATLHRRALDHFDQLVHGIRPDQWHDSTPCTEWDVTALVHHVASENAWVPPMLAERTIAEVGDSLDGDLLGDDPVGAWERYAQGAKEAIDAPRAMSATVHASSGDISAEQYLLEMFGDLVIHGWDLSRATGQDERIEPDLVEEAFAVYEPLVAAFRRYGAFGEEVVPPPDADRQTQLLAMTGRRV
jgi:uncharacterized protein (TIGR03086 family)